MHSPSLFDPTSPEAIRRKQIQRQCADDRSFQEWFRGSWVVDENDHPLLVFHGSIDKIETFDASKTITGGIFFTASHNYAASHVLTIKGSETGYLHPSFLALRNPLEMRPSPDEWSMPVHERDWIVKAKDEGYDGLILTGPKHRFYVAFEGRQIRPLAAVAQH